MVLLRALPAALPRHEVLPNEKPRYCLVGWRRGGVACSCFSFSAPQSRMDHSVLDAEKSVFVAAGCNAELDDHGNAYLRHQTPCHVAVVRITSSMVFSLLNNGSCDYFSFLRGGGADGVDFSVA